VWWFVVACSSSSVASTSATTNGATLTTSLFSVLSLDDEAAPRQPVKMGEGASGAIELLHLSEHVSKDEETLLTLIDQAKQKRCVASTEMNDASSRSHGVAIFTIEHGKTEGNVPLPKAGKLYGTSRCLHDVLNVCARKHH
jgi:hypothetical protein